MATVSLPGVFLEGNDSGKLERNRYRIKMEMMGVRFVPRIQHMVARNTDRQKKTKFSSNPAHHACHVIKIRYEA